jgi:serine phosphatase RsbU (regulator of sigma subunit)
VPRPIPDYLRLHPESLTTIPQEAGEVLPGLGDLCLAFEQATGWPMRFVPEGSPPPDDALWTCPNASGRGARIGRLAIVRDAAEPVAHRAAPPAAARLGSAVAGLVGDLLLAHRSLAEREAELAAGVPVADSDDARRRLTGRLEGLVASATEALDCQGGGLYLLDAETTELKLRSCWGLPLGRFTDPPRPLTQALADLEAMAGHAVALPNRAAAAAWNPPEDAAAALCIPVSSPTTVLGTLWLFADQAREFSSRQVNIAEIVAGRLAVELECEMLASEARTARRRQHDLDAAEEYQREQLPHVAPVLAGWDVAGWTGQAQAVGGDFHDWFAVATDKVAVAAGEVSDRGLPAAIAAGGLRAALRAHGAHLESPGRLLEYVNRSLWSGSAGGTPAAVVLGVLDPQRGQVRYAWAGYPSILHVDRAGHRQDAGIARMPLGVDPASGYAERAAILQPGEALVFLSDGVRAAFAEEFQNVGVSSAAEMVRQSLDAPAAALVDLVRARLEAHGLETAAHDQAIVVVKRTE